METKRLTYQQLEELTNNFAEERRLGAGTFGVVYKGVKINDEEIAVKVLKDFTPDLDDEKFKKEFYNLVRLKHQNIVKLLGYCYETHHMLEQFNGKHVFAGKTYRALCFEYLPKGSLRNHLSDACDGLNWHTRYAIIKGTCEGLKYLHKGSTEPILHLDLKPDNILLDLDMSPKLADFGLSRILSEGKSRATNTSDLGTRGYVPREYIDRNIVSTKFDIFSLGAVILEVIAGLSARSRSAEMERQEFIDLVQQNWRMRLQATWSGSSLDTYCRQVMCSTQIALECMDDDRQKRPDILDIIDELNQIETEIEKSMLLTVLPIELQFTMEPINPIMSCSLNLINKTNDYVAFRLQTKNPDEHISAPICGVMPPCSSRTIAVSRQYKLLELPVNKTQYFTLESSIVVNHKIHCAKTDAVDSFDRICMEARKNGHEVHKMKLMAVYVPPVAGKAITELRPEKRAKTVSINGIPNKMSLELKKTTDERQCFNLATGPSSSELQDVDIRETAANIEEPIVGREKEKNKILDSLCGHATEKVTILPIYGIGGIGKTTFAKLIFGDIQFKGYSQVWIYVSQNFNLKKIGNSIISQLSGKESQLAERQIINNFLKEQFADKKILIVLDDLWEGNDNQLSSLKAMLKLGDNSNKIVIVTTRNEDIAKKICTIKPYKIEQLTDDLCWDIIQRKANFEARDNKEQLEKVGRVIAVKCGGVALAAQSLGCMLKEMSSDEWKSVKDNHIWNEEIPEDASSADHVLLCLKLSYESMPQNLKSCFSYCAIFPKGHTIDKYDLISQWASLDIIKRTNIYSTQQLGEKFIRQLQGLSFLEHSKPPLTSVVYHEDATLFIMHDLVHDLARSVLADKILDGSIQGNTGGRSCWYALLTDCSKQLGLSTTSPDRLKALRFIECAKIELHDSAFSAATSLSILDLSECFINKLPDSIGRLVELRYLNAPGIHDERIPNCITKLSKLNYLNIRGSSEILALPEAFGEMENLTYLDLSGCKKLQELPESFGYLKNLEHLDLSMCSEVTGVSHLLGSLLKLQYLNLSYCKNIGKLRRVLGSLTELQYLNLSHSSYLNVHVAEVLGSLTKLVYLNLSSERSSLIRLPESIGSFTELKYLNLSGCMDLKELPKSFWKLSSLVHLDLSRCYDVEGVPEALRGLTKLRYLNLGDCSASPEHQHFEGLRGLQEVMGNLTELCYLNLNCCLELMFGYDEKVEEISKFLGTIGTLSNLEHLDLSHNYSINSIPETLGGLRKLRTLNLSYCSKLQMLPASVFQIGSLKFLSMTNCEKLDKSMIPQFNNTSIIFPHFVVRATDGEFSSTLVQLEDEDPPILEISKLENVKSAEEAQTIKLRDKKMMDDLSFVWTTGAKRFMEDDIELLEELVPADTLTQFQIKGYSSITFPRWVMDIAEYLPQLVRIFIIQLPRCHTLPPLGQLPNLGNLHIEGMDSIRKIDDDLYGGAGAFPQLKCFYLFDMKSLEEWNMTCTSAGDDATVLVFPNLTILSIKNCPKLRLKPCPPRASCDYSWEIERSDDVISSWEEIGQVHYYRDKEISIEVENCGVPLDRWRLLHHLPYLTRLTIRDCSDLTCSSADIIEGLCFLQSLTVADCESIEELPDWLGQLELLLHLCIDNCESIKSLPDSLLQLTFLTRLQILGCPELEQWFESEENSRKFRRIKIEIDGYPVWSDHESGNDQEIDGDEEMESDVGDYNQTEIIDQLGFD